MITGRTAWIVHQKDVRLLGNGMQWNCMHQERGRAGFCCWATLFAAAGMLLPISLLRISNSYHSNNDWIWSGRIHKADKHMNIRAKLVGILHDAAYGKF